MIIERVVLTYGTFDMFHIGHVRLLTRLRNLGTKLIVAVSTDEFNALKGKKTVIPYEQRIEIVSALRVVDNVIAESSWDQKIPDVVKYAVSVFGMGSDWEGKFDFLKPHCEVVYLPRTEGLSSTSIKEQVVINAQGTTVRSVNGQG